MQAQRHLIPVAVLLLAFSLCGCGKLPSQLEQSANPAGQNSASQPDANAAPTDNSASNAVPPANGPASSATSASSAAPEPLIIPAGTPITVRLQQSLSSASAAPGERFDAVIDEPVVVSDRVILPVGTPVTGHVVVARRSGRLHHPGELGLTLDTVTVDQQEISLVTSSVVARGGSHKKRNWALIGGGTGGGALIGALAAGGKGALIGTGIGAAAGTTTAFVTGKKDVGFGAERRLRFRLRNDVSLSA